MSWTMLSRKSTGIGERKPRSLWSIGWTPIAWMDCFWTIHHHSEVAMSWKKCTRLWMTTATTAYLCLADRARPPMSNVRRCMRWRLGFRSSLSSYRQTQGLHRIWCRTSGEWYKRQTHHLHRTIPKSASHFTSATDHSGVGSFTRGFRLTFRRTPNSSYSPDFRTRTEKSWRHPAR